MEILAVVLLISGGLIVAATFIIPVKKEETSKEIKEMVQNEVDHCVKNEVEGIRKHVDGVVDEVIEYAQEKTERSLERISNEKIMAVNEYSDTVLSEIHKNHEEVMFLYDMLNDKQETLQATVSAANEAAKEVKKQAKEAVEAAKAAAEMEPPMPKIGAYEPAPKETKMQEKTSPQNAFQRADNDPPFTDRNGTIPGRSEKESEIDRLMQAAIDEAISMNETPIIGELVTEEEAATEESFEEAVLDFVSIDNAGLDSDTGMDDVNSTETDIMDAATEAADNAGTIELDETAATMEFDETAATIESIESAETADATAVTGITEQMEEQPAVHEPEATSRKSAVGGKRGGFTGMVAEAVSDLISDVANIVSPENELFNIPDEDPDADPAAMGEVLPKASVQDVQAAYENYEASVDEAIRQANLRSANTEMSASSLPFTKEANASDAPQVTEPVVPDTKELEGIKVPTIDPLKPSPEMAAEREKKVRTLNWAALAEAEANASSEGTNDIHKQISTLHDLGEDSTSIAKKLNMGVGEVELIISLYGNSKDKQ